MVRLLALCLLLAGCSAEEPRLVVQADACWGHPDCAQALDAVRSALGAEGFAASSRDAASASGCGPVVDCSARTPALAQRPPSGAVSGEDPASEAATPRESATPAPRPNSEPAPDMPDRIAAASSTGCEDTSAGGLEKAATLSPADVLCLGEMARGAVTSSDTDRQIAAVALYNHKSAGWPDAVEAALKRPSLRNAPALNFAGIKPAYDRSQYATVVSRANVVWRNLEKGYQLSSSDMTFLAEFACRSAGQLALQGDPPDAGLDWCERWMSQATKAGGNTGPIQDLIDQLE